MDAFKRATLLTAQAALGQVTSDEVRKEMADLIPQMAADPEAQLPKPAAAQEEAPQQTPAKNW